MFSGDFPYWDHTCTCGGVKQASTAKSWLKDIGSIANKDDCRSYVVPVFICDKCKTVYPIRNEEEMSVWVTIKVLDNNNLNSLIP